MSRTKLFAVSAISVLVSPAIFSQLQHTAPVFEVASIRPTPKDRLYLFKRECKGDRFVAAGVPLSFVITWSYELSNSRILGMPDWVKDREYAYDIEAKSTALMSDEQCKLMVRSLLADRFKMAVHREAREIRAYALTVGKNGAKLHVVTPEVAGDGVRINGARFQTVSDPEGPKGLSMPRLAEFLGNLPAVGLPVVDRTALSGIYSFDLAFSLRDGDDRPSIFTALQEQLGLKLESTKAPVEFLVVDHIEKASVN